MDPAFVLQFLQETYKKKPQDLHMASADRLSLHSFDMSTMPMTEIPEGCVNVRNAGSIVDRHLLNTKWMLPNSTIVLSMWFIIRSKSFTVWDISFILQMLLHSSMIPFPLNSGVGSPNLHEYAMADVSTTSISFSIHTNPCSLVFFILQWESVLITCLIHLHLTQLLSDLFYGYRRYFSFSISFIQ